MKHSHDYFDNEKKKQKDWKKEHNAGGFRCSHCRRWTVINDYIGTANRNHCNICLWSKHVDEKKGDRRSTCNGGMAPIGVTYKHEGWGKQGEIMLIHQCMQCSKLSINRIAADDVDSKILSVFERSLNLPQEVKKTVQKSGITPLEEPDRGELSIQLFGVNHPYDY